MVARSTRYLIVLLAAALSPAEDFKTLEQAGSRSGTDLTAAYENHPVSIRAQVATAPIWAVGMYYLPVRDLTDHGLILRGDRDQFSDLVPGDWIEVRGTIQSRGGMPLLAPSSLVKLRHDPAPEPKNLTVAELCAVRYLGLLVRTEATVTSIGENLGGKTLQVADRGASLAVFLPRSATSNVMQLARLRVGDRVRMSGVATQYSLEPPHDRGFQLMLPVPEDVEILPGRSMLVPLLMLGAAGVIAILLSIWWIRERHMGKQRRSMRAFHSLSEEIIAAASPAEIAGKLVTVLPTITQATSVRLYLFGRRSKSLERVPTSADPEPVALPVDTHPEGLAGGAVVCYRNRTLLNVPDVRRSPFVSGNAKSNLPRSTMFVPMFAQNEVLGVLEVGNSRRPGYFTLEEQAATQHLANQVAASLKLQEQQTIREQLFRSEKLAATGQLISGVASELRAPLESILQLASSLAAYAGRPVPERDLKHIAGESQRAAEIVSRLVSFARPEDSGATHVDVTALVTSLMQFREPEWKTQGLRIHNRLAPEPAVVLGAQGQIEQVFLNLLVHAEQRAGQAPGKAIAVSSSVIARRVTVEIKYSTPLPESDDGEHEQPSAEAHTLESTAMGLGVCQGIIQSHGGEIRFSSSSGSARFEVDLPVAQGSEQTDSAERNSGTPLTLMVVDPDAGNQRQLVALLGARGHRVVPVQPEESVDLAQRLRFDAVIWMVRPSGARWSDFQERIRTYIRMFVLLSEGYDADLARTLEENGGFLLGRPIQEAELDRILKAIEAGVPNASAARGR